MESEMKKIMLFTAVLLVAAGCAKELEVIDIQDETPVETVDETPQVTIIRAGFEGSSPETRSHIEMNEAGTSAKVLWTGGDKIKLLGLTESGNVYSSIFTTSDDGVSSADFSCSDWNPNGECIYYYGFYPSASYQGVTKVNGDLGIGAVIPSSQTAVPGGIAEGLNVSYSSTASISETFTFRNIPSLIKFRLSGNIVGDIASVKFVANATISGEGVVFNLDGTPTFDFNRWFGERDMPSSFVLLNKPSAGFEADVDYYIAVFPGVTEGFSMVFTAENGDYLVKTSTKTLELNRSEITDFGTINVGNSFGDPLVTQYKARSSSSSFKPVDIVVIPDGFTKTQRESFEARAKEGIDFLFGTEPYKSYEKYFNVYFIWAASKEEGASVTDGKGHILDDGFHDTAFGSRWGAGANEYEDMQADSDKVFGYVSAHCPEIVRGELTIDEVPILLIINDNRFGGRAITYSSGRSYCLAPYTNDGGSISWPYPGLMPDSVFNESIDSNDPPCHATDESEYSDAGGSYFSGDWRNTLLHEFGDHSFGRLEDEYWYNSWYDQSDIRGHDYPVPFGLNISGRYGSYLWQDLLDRRDALVAQNPLYQRIGVFQGAGVSLFNRWRSEFVSCMINNRPYFSTWQRVLIAKRIMGLANGTFDLDAFLESNDPVDPSRDDPAGKADVNSKGPLVVAPLLPPPILIDNTSAPGE